jgi:hypothetical protein
MSGWNIRTRIRDFCQTRQRGQESEDIYGAPNAKPDRARHLKKCNMREGHSVLNVVTSRLREHCVYPAGQTRCISSSVAAVWQISLAHTSIPRIWRISRHARRFMRQDVVWTGGSGTQPDLLRLNDQLSILLSSSCSSRPRIRTGKILYTAHISSFCRLGIARTPSHSVQSRSCLGPTPYATV